MNFIVILVIVCLLVQLIYWNLIFRRAADDIHPASSTDHEPPFLSVVICFHKTWDKTPEVLQCMEQQTYQNFEVILVNDGPVSLDPEITERHIQSKNHIRYIEHVKHSPGKKGALAAGIQAAAGDWIVLADIDCQPGPGWLETMAAHLPDEPAILLGYSPYVSHPGILNFIIQQETLLTAFQYLGWARSGHAYMGVGRNMAYHKSIYENITFDAHRHVPMGDDDLFVNEAAKNHPVYICSDPSGFVISEPKTSWHAWYLQKSRHKSGGKYYSLASKLRLTLFMLALFIEKITLLFFLFVRIDIFLIFVVSKMAITAKPLRKLYRRFDHTRHFWKMWLYEWIHIVYLVLISPFIFIKTKKEWD